MKLIFSSGDFKIKLAISNLVVLHLARKRIKSRYRAWLTNGTQIKIKSNLSICLLYYAEACNELARPIFASLRLGNIAHFEEMFQRWQAVGNIVEFNRPRIEPLTYRSRDERVTARPTGRSNGTQLEDW